MILAVGFGIGFALLVASHVAWTHATALGTAATVLGVVLAGICMGWIIRTQR
ncbi:hypothetical protein [Methylobacterium sp. Leaf111]|uniref:hypothetical protein n=1 Tax=Methylobacterium sp. Leaf111 TaxID=1736257 RepID=UPI000B2D8C5D|nr:hypothetical protein [Methylobacterium sp. Leaf111]